MSDKFRYAPGMPGFGTKGSDGSAGLQGLSMYFTDFNPDTQASSINTRIANNQILWSTTSDVLPSGRVYVTGDLFVDDQGRVYEINAETDTFQYKFANINTSGYFISAETTTDTYTYNRYFNSNDSPKYIIDNVYAEGFVAYYDIPSEIYNIFPKNFARIEYSNIEQGNYNPFTLYSSGETNPIDDHKAIALVRDVNSNTFRLGNLNSTGNLRNVNLTFDVSSLKRTKQDISKFNVNTPPGEILTNYEIDANSLFTGVFNTNPVSFMSTVGVDNITISWNLSRFTNDPDIKADLYFFKNSPVSGTISFTSDSSAYHPMIFHDVSTTGSINLTGLETTTAYKYYMNFYKNGWERRSVTKTATTGAIPNISIIPSSITCTSTAQTVGFCVSSNVPWTAAFYGTNTFMSNISSGYEVGVSDAALQIDVCTNLEFCGRTGQFRISAIDGGGNSPVTGEINQGGYGETVIVDISAGTLSDIGNTRRIIRTQNWTLKLSGLPTDSTVDISIYWNSLVDTMSGDGYQIDYANDIYVVPVGKSSSYKEYYGNLTSPGQSDEYFVIGLTDISISNLDILVRLSIDAELVGYPETYWFDANSRITDIIVKQKSGTSLCITYDDVDAYVSDYRSL